MHSLDNGKYKVESDTLYHNSTIPGVKVKRGIIPSSSDSVVCIKIINLQNEPDSVQKHLVEYLTTQYDILKTFKHPNILSVIDFSPSSTLAKSNLQQNLVSSSQPRGLLEGQNVDSTKFNQKANLGGKVLVQGQQANLKRKKCSYIVHEAILKESLLDLVSAVSKNGLPFDQQVARFYFMQLLEAIREVHKQGICFRNITPASLRLDLDGNLKICEFKNSGYLDKYKDGKMHTKVERLDFLPPEAVFPTKYSHQTSLSGSKGIEYSAPVLEYSGVDADLFSACCVLFWIVIGQQPFKMVGGANSYRQYFIQERQQQFWRLVEQSRKIEIRNDLKLFLNTMFDNDPAKRLTLSEVLSNTWVRGRIATREQIKQVIDIRREMMKKRTVQISQNALKGRIGGVFKNRGNVYGARLVKGVGEQLKQQSQAEQQKQINNIKNANAVNKFQHQMESRNAQSSKITYINQKTNYRSLNQQLEESNQYN